MRNPPKNFGQVYRQGIHLVLDNARYQKCKAVHGLASELCIDLVCIPPYSPNLNLIERLWKFVKGELRTEYYDDFEVFRSRIDQIIASTSTYNESKISKLIGNYSEPSIMTLGAEQLRLLETKYNFSMISNKSIPTHLSVPNLRRKNLKIKN